MAVPMALERTRDGCSASREADRLHPNAIKALARCGQGYSLSDEGLAPVAYGMLPALNADDPLAEPVLVFGYSAKVMPSGVELYPVFTRVRIVPRPALEEFVRTWQYHHPLLPEQLPYGGTIATVRAVSMYHGGDMLYELAGIPGYWHEQLLQPLTLDAPSVDL